MIVKNYLKSFFTKINGVKHRLIKEKLQAYLKNSHWESYVFFLPGALLMLTGMAFILAPNLIIFLIAFFFFFIGAIVWFIAYKLLLLKYRVERIIRSFEGRIILQAGGISSGLANDEKSSSTSIIETSSDGRKKTYLH